MNISSLPGALAFALFLPSVLHAQTLELTLNGSIDTVDPALSGTFAIGDSFEMKVQFDASAGWDMWGDSTNLDGTQFSALCSDGICQNSFSVGSTYTASSSPVGVIFIDNDSGAQMIDPGANNYNGPDVAGLVLRQIYFDHELNGTPLPGANDPSDILNADDLLSLNGATFNSPQDNSISFSSTASSSDYQRLHFSLDAVSIQSLEPQRNNIIYYGQAAISDLNGNGSPEIASLRSVASGKVNVLVRDSVTGDFIKTISFLGTKFQPISITSVPDGNGNGADELSVMALDPIANRTRTVIKDSLTNQTIIEFSWAR